MAAIPLTLPHFLPMGSHIVITDDCYRRSRQLCEKLLSRNQVPCSGVPCDDMAALEAAIRPERRVLFSETPTNPYLRLLDLGRIAGTGHRR
jgi:cystathionine gamma-synthase